MKTFILGFLVLSAGVAKADGDREAFHKAMEACVAETGVTKPERGSRPSDADRAKMDACLSSKGISKPQGLGHGHGRGGPGGDNGSEPSL